MRHKAVLAAALVALAGMAGCGPSNSLSGDTPCKEYLAADPTEKEQVVRQLAVDQESSQAGGAFLILNVNAICGQEPETKLRDAILK